MSDERTSCPLPSRRQWQGRESVRSGSHGLGPADSASSSRSTGRGARVGLLLALGAMTVAIPLSGFVGADSSVALPSRALGTSKGASTWVTSASSQIIEADLQGSITAASRARVRTPITVVQCLAGAGVANGEREIAVEAEALYWPIAAGRYTFASAFGYRVSPISGQLLMHEGIDQSAAMGEPLHSVFSGVVVEVDENSRSGAYVKIKHTRGDGSVFYSLYLHQYMNDILVAKGDEVTAGQQIGAVGSNGWSTGPHLHFEIHNEKDEPVDPQAWMEDNGAIHIGEEACG